MIDTLQTPATIASAVVAGVWLHVGWMRLQEWRVSRQPEPEPERIWAPLGGWTPSYEGDMCQGGHPPQSVHVEVVNGQRVALCGRCGRYLDQRGCGCGSHDGSALTRSFCPNRVRQDQIEVERLARAGVVLPR